MVSVCNDAREVEFNSLNGGDYGEHNLVGFVEISRIVVMNDSFFAWTWLFDKAEVMLLGQLCIGLLRWLLQKVTR